MRKFAVRAKKDAPLSEAAIREIIYFGGAIEKLRVGRANSSSNSSTRCIDIALKLSFSINSSLTRFMRALPGIPCTQLLNKVSERTHSLLLLTVCSEPNNRIVLKGRKMDDVVSDWIGLTDRITGHVRWFDPEKGYGFIRAAEVDGDVLLHRNVLRNFGQNSTYEGCEVEFILEEGKAGRRAARILSIRPPLNTIAVDEEIAVDIAMSIPVRVSWFDYQRGFGFVRDFASGAEVFLGLDTLQKCGFADAQTGEALRVLIADGDRGPFVTSILPWRYSGNGASLPNITQATTPLPESLLVAS